jgi:hypothetical protein
MIFALFLQVMLSKQLSKYSRIATENVLMEMIMAICAQNNANIVVTVLGKLGADLGIPHLIGRVEIRKILKFKEKRVTGVDVN